MIGSVSEFAKLAVSDTEEDYLRATTDVAPTFVWEEILRQRPELAELVAHSQTIPDSVLESITILGPWRARYLVAGQARTPGFVLAKLANDGDSRVQKAALGNPNLALKLVGELRHHPNPEVAQTAQMVWEDRTRRSGKHTVQQAGWDVPEPPPEPISPASQVGRYTSYFDELVARYGIDPSQVVRSFDPRDSDLPFAPEGPWVVAPWGEEYVVGSQRGNEFAVYEIVPSLEVAVETVSHLVSEVLPKGPLPEDAPARGAATEAGIVTRTKARGGKPGPNALKVGDLLDCFDNDKAQFLFAMGTSLAKRGARITTDKPYRVFQVMAPLPLAVLEGLTAPAAKTAGGGAIVVLDRPLRWYLDHSFLLELG